MGRDNSPKERQQKQLRRKMDVRASYDRILIVSEGGKTEPNYFNEIRIKYRLCTANVVVYPSAFGTQPSQVVEYAQDLFENGDRQKGIEPRAFEKVYAVFDRDEHISYFDGLSKAESLNGKLKNDLGCSVLFKAIASIPNFELWLLLHYEDIQAPLHRDEVIKRLKKHIPKYEKSANDSFAITAANLDNATQRAKRLAERFSAYTAPEPFTAIDEVVKLLITLRR